MWVLPSVLPNPVSGMLRNRGRGYWSCDIHDNYGHDEVVINALLYITG